MDQVREASLRSRVPAQAVMTELLRRQADTTPHSRLARLLGRSPLTADTRSWYLGALGELEVGALLDRLPAGWYVLHAVPVGDRGADVDHVVVGPAGVFTVNTKHHAGQRVWVAGRTFRVAGRPQLHVRNAEHEADRAARRLSAALGVPVAVTVTPVIAVVAAESLTVKAAPDRVVVVTADRLVRELRRRPGVLSDEQVHRLVQAAELPGTWQDVPVELSPAAVVQSGFRALHREVREARLVRGAWSLAGTAGGAVAALTVGTDLLERAVGQLLA